MPAHAYHPNVGPFTVSDLAQRLSLTVKGDETAQMTDVLPLKQAELEHLSFFDNPRYKADLEVTKAGAVILKEEFVDVLPKGVTALISEEPYADYARALALFYPPQGAGQGIHPTAVVDETAKIGATTSVGPHCYIGPGVEIGEGCLIGANVTIQCTQMGNGVIVHPGAAIGQDGFGFAPCRTGIVKVPQVGGVVVEDGVEIGANSTIDRGALADTLIGAGTKIDNLVQIAHNVKIGKMCMIVAQAGIAGSTTLGNGVVIGGQAGVAGHLRLADRIMVAGRAGVTKSFDEVGMTLGGFPAMAVQQWRRLQGMLSRMSKNQARKS